MKIRISFIVLALICGQDVYADGSTAANADLSAAFCLPAMRYAATLICEERKHSEQLESHCRRQNFKVQKVDNYLKARLLSLGPAGVSEVLVASQAGRNAMTSTLDILSKCVASVDRTGSLEEVLAKIDKCKAANGIDDLGIRKCQDTSFLPY